MTNWKHVVDAFFKNSDPDGDFRHIANPGASLEAIATAELKLGVALPEELRSFLRSYNGIGMSSDGQPDTPRLIPPVEGLPEFAAHTRTLFQSTHPDHAARFIPFLDFENGDVMGYLIKPDGIRYPFLVCFLHERYKGVDTQDVNDFLESGPESLVDLLAPDESAG